MAKAYAHSLPGSLDQLCEIFALPQDARKQKIGRSLVQLFCKPRPANQKLRRATRITHPVEWAQFLEYARLDCEAMRSVYSKTPAWNWTPREIESWRLDQEINDRGFLVDTGLAEGALRAVDRAQTILTQRTHVLTNGVVAKTTQRDELLAHILAEYDIELPDMQAATLERRIQDPELPSALKDLLQVRLQATTSSTAKYKRALKALDHRGRACGTLQWCGAQRTGRWSGRTVQPQNFPRPTLSGEDIDVGIEALRNGCAHLVVDNVMELASNALRGLIVPSAGRSLYVSDLSNIEGRDTAWLGGEQWKLDAFNAYDRGAGPDLYKVAYARCFNMDPGDVDKEQRQVGKVLELSMGFEGGVGAFVAFATAYGLNLDKLADQAQLPKRIIQEAQEFYDWTLRKNRNTFGLGQDTFIVCEGFKRLWREAHPGIVKLWKSLKDAAVTAITNPGQSVAVGRVRLQRGGGWLRVILPSGRQLSYPSPRVENGSISYLGMDQYTKRWSRLKTFGGKLTENIAQAVARDVMTYNMPSIQADGFDIVLTVHDEILAESDPDRDPAQLARLLAQPHTWCDGLPLAASGAVMQRYKKD